VSDEAVGVASWLRTETHLDLDVGSARLQRLAGGNSNVTYLLTAGEHHWIVRRPPLHVLDASAHSMVREWTLLTSLADTAVPTAQPVAHCQDPTVLGAEFLVMEYLAESVSLSDHLPKTYPSGTGTLAPLGFALVDALIALQAVDWRDVGLSEFGRPVGFLDRQVPRWEAQYRRNQVRDIESFELVAAWLRDNRPAEQPPSVIHGDFHLDNCLFAEKSPTLLAVIDWEMASIGDPLVDLGLMLAFWGRRAFERPAMPSIQAVSRRAGSPTREELIGRYARASGRDLSGITWYQVFAFWKLASIIEAAWAQHTRGELRTDYSVALERDVPMLFDEAAVMAGLIAPPRALA
jgi:aminoglycoside phosphotransferase (APT) family kinase protein